MSETTYTNYHMCISVRGMLAWGERETKRQLRSITKDDGTRFSGVREFRDMLMDELAAGHEVLPMGKACDNFDWKKGCQGHRKEPHANGE
jgi:hypothetical protein